MSPIEFWREQGTGIMLMVRLPSGSEVVYVGGQQFGEATQHEIDGAIRFLRGLRNEKPDYDAHTGGVDGE
jgi:hypothetical protein